MYVVRVKMEICYELKVRAQSAEEFVRNSLDVDFKCMGWKQIIVESLSVHWSVVTRRSLAT